MLQIDQLLSESESREIKQRITKSSIILQDIADHDHGNFLKTFNYFLDNLLCDFSQNVDAVKTYD